MLYEVVVSGPVDLFTCGRFEHERLGRDRLVEADRKRGYSVKRLPVPDSGDAEQNAELLVDLQLVVLAAAAEFVQLESSARAPVLRAGDRLRRDAGSTRDLGAPGHTKTQQAPSC